MSVKTKAGAAARLMYVAQSLARALGGDEDADLAVSMIEAIAYDLDQATFVRLYEYRAGPSRKMKLRALIDHPRTPEAEREAARAALRRLAAAGVVAQPEETRGQVGGHE